MSGPADRAVLDRALRGGYNFADMRRDVFVGIVMGHLLCGVTMTMGGSSQAWRFGDDRLENGLRVLTMEDHRVPIVSIQVWFHVGSKNEDPQRQGFAHMFEHMMFRGSDRIGPQDHFKYLQQSGAQVNGYTSFDETVYWETLPSERLDLALWLEAERMGRLRIDEEYFAAEREVVKEELRMRILNRPYGMLREELHAAAFEVHPYRWTPIGKLDHLNAATADELRAFFKTYYTPNNATLVVVGDITREEVLAKARKYLEPVSRGVSPLRVTALEPPPLRAKTVEMTDKAPSPLVACAYHSPAARDPEAIVMEILTRILAGGQSSRMYRHLVQGKELAVNVTSYDQTLEQAGLLVVQATLKPTVTVEAGEQAILAEVSELLAKGIEPAELAKARNQAIAAYVRMSETDQGRASQLGYAAVVLGDVDRVNTDLQRLRTVTAEQVMTVARRIFTDTNRVTVRIRPDERAMAGEAVPDKSSEKREPVVDHPPPADMPVGEPLRAVEVPIPIMRKLANGLEIMVVTDHSTPAVTVSFGALIGSRDDPSDLGGLAEVTANTLRRGTSRHSGDELAEIIDSHAISLDERVDSSDTTIGLWTLTEHLDLAVETLAEVVRKPVFPEKEVASFATRAAARRAIDEKDPSTIADRRLAREVYGDYYLGRPSNGTSVSLKRITRDRVAGFHQRFFAPDVGCLVFAGDITSERAMALADKWFGDWAGQSARTPASAPPAAKANRVVLVDQPKALQSEIRIGQVVSLNRRDPDYPAARLLSQIFGASFTSRLNRVLRIEKGLTYYARGYFDIAADAASLNVATFTRTDRTTEAVRTMIGELERLRKPGITGEELTTARNTLIGGFQIELETPSRIASLHWNLKVWHLPPTWYGDYLGRLAAISDPGVLTRVAEQKIDPLHLAIVVVGNAAELAEPLSAIATVERATGD